MNDFIPIAALVVSLLALWQTHRVSADSKRLTEQEIELIRQQLAANRLAAVQEKQASISARMYKDGKSWRVSVYNSGPAEAKNVRLLHDDTNQLVSKDAIDGKFPLVKMEKGQSVDFWANVHMTSPLKETLVIQWDDLSGPNRENRVEITV